MWSSILVVPIKYRYAEANTTIKNLQLFSFDAYVAHSLLFMIIHEFTPAVVPTSIIICWISYASSKIPANIKKCVSDRFINWSVFNRSLGWTIKKGKLGLSEVSTFEAFGRKSIYFMFMRSI